MTEQARGEYQQLTRQQASDAVTGLGWRFVLGELRTQVLTGSLPLAADLAGRAAAVPGTDGHLRMDVRSDRVLLALQTAATGWVTGHDTGLARRITDAVGQAGLQTDPAATRPVQVLEIAIDTLDVTAIRAFWKAVLDYDDEPGAPRPGAGLIDPLGQGPAVWFQQMDAPREQRNRIHLDVSVPHDEAGHRIGAALAAGGRMASDAHAPAFWVLADAEGNEACVTTWQGRDS
jgi:4a-hydroxytetrahydrobiopterin dehydratase